MEKVSEKCNLAEEGYAKMVRYIIDGIKAKIGTSGRWTGRNFWFSYVTGRIGGFGRL